MPNKKLEIKRIIIFCILAVIPMIIIAVVTSDGFKNMYWANAGENQIKTMVSGLGMFAPALAVLATRLITKEGFKDSYLGLNFRGNAKYYILSIIVPLLNNFVGMLCIWLFYMDSSFSETFTMEYFDEVLPILLYNIALSIILIPHIFGEEWGWRGYLMPKLLKLMNKPMAIIVGGIIWGLWHAPLTVIGHDFGVDYPLFPWLGIIAMCISCTLMNAFMTLITERTKSIYPTCFIHGLNNNIGAAVLLSMFAKEDVLAEQTASIKSGMDIFPALIVALSVIFIVSMIIFCRKEKADFTAEN